MTAADESIVDVDGERRWPVYGMCDACSHRWIVFYAPMDLTSAGKLMSNACCPLCACTKVSIIGGVGT